MKTKIWLLFTLFVFTGEILATESDSNHLATATSTDDIEVIEVVGRFSKAQWKQIAESAKVDFYDLYNKFNTIKKFDVECKLTKAIGSNIKRNVCEPVYFKQAFYHETQVAVRSSGRPGLDLRRLPSAEKMLFLTQQMKEESDAHMEALIEQNPSLRKKFEFYAKAKMASELRDNID